MLLGQEVATRDCHQELVGFMERRDYSDGLSGWICIVFVASAILSSSAFAQTVNIDVEGTLEASCALNGVPASVVALGDLSVAGSQTSNFSVDCNTQFAYALVSANGGLLHDGLSAPVSGSQPFATAVPYSVTTTFNSDAGAFGDAGLQSVSLTATNAAPCTGALWSPTCPFSNSGTGAAAAGLPASLTVSWTPPSDPLQGGSYSDQLTLTVRARP